jgi:hypothetical protein
MVLREFIEYTSYFLIIMYIHNNTVNMMSGFSRTTQVCLCQFHRTQSDLSEAKEHSISKTNVGVDTVVL